MTCLSQAHTQTCKSPLVFCWSTSSLLGEAKTSSSIKRIQMRVRVMLITCTLLLLSLLSFPVKMYMNTSTTCARDVAVLPQALQRAEVVVALRPLFGDQWSLSPNNKQLPQTRQIYLPGAAFIAINFQRLELLPGDKLVVRDPNGTTISTATATNASALGATISPKSPLSMLLWTHPFLVEGDTVVIEYFPGVLTMILASQRNNPPVIIDSYSYVNTRGGFGASVSTPKVGGSTSTAGPVGSSLGEGAKESTIGSTDEAKEAVCYRKTQPKMYAKARAVARLMIRSERSSKDHGFEQLSTWVFCTGWLIGRGNHLLTNHHCLKDAAVVERAVGTQTEGEGLLSRAITHIWPNAASQNKTGQEVEAVVGFMAETKSCREAGFMGEKVGIVEATRVVVVAENPELDYALLRVLVNNSATHLDRRYGYLRLRATGPMDREQIYIPQHPRGEPKEIAATKDGKPAVIEVPAASSTASGSWSCSGYLRRDSKPTESPSMVLYNADTEPGSSGSPVLSREDNTVVALHRAGGSGNAFNVGIRTDLVAQDLQQRNVLPLCALAS